VEEISKKYLLNEDETETLQLETASFLLGLVNEESYTINIEDSVGISKNEAEKITEEINQKIFTPIYTVISENIKNKFKDKNPNWKQSVNFILSGGDYSVFLEEDSDLHVYDASKTKTLDNSSKINDIKSKFIM
jgi:hypothetical protein